MCETRHWKAYYEDFSWFLLQKCIYPFILILTFTNIPAIQYHIHVSTSIPDQWCIMVHLNEIKWCSGSELTISLVVGYIQSSLDHLLVFSCVSLTSIQKVCGQLETCYRKQKPPAYRLPGVKTAWFGSEILMYLSSFKLPMCTSDVVLLKALRCLPLETYHNHPFRYMAWYSRYYMQLLKLSQCFSHFSEVKLNF